MTQILAMEGIVHLLHTVALFQESYLSTLLCSAQKGIPLICVFVYEKET